MIEINLIRKQKSNRLPTILGIDLGKINFVGVILGVVFYYLPGWLVYPHFKAKEQVLNKEMIVLNQQFRKEKKAVDANKNIKDKLRAYNQQVEKLKTRSKQVDSVIKQKRNPKMILENIARKIPDDMWIDSLEINIDKKIKLMGAALNYSSISEFLLAGNESNFFGKTLNLTSSNVKEVDYKSTKVRVESFEINGMIEAFDPWNEK